MSEAQKASIVQNAGVNMAQPTVQPWVTPQQPVSNPVSPVQMPQGMARPNYGLLAQQNYQTGYNSVPNQMRSFYQRPGFDPNQFANTIQAQNQFAQQLRDMANAPVKPMFKPATQAINPVATDPNDTRYVDIRNTPNYVG
jgi:hypothetical protein